MQRYEIVRKIGKGSFGTVELIKRRTDAKSFVLKRMKIGSVSKKERDMCHNEVQLLEQLNHPSIVRYEESFVHKQHSESYLCVVMAYCDGGDLTHFLKNQRGRKLKEKQILDLFIQIALALHFIHQRNILHRDLKTQNIFVKNGQLKLGDFGISKVLTGSVAFAQTMIGTPYYMSPEVFKGKPYNFKSDIWSLGCVLYELITFKHCFDANNLNSLASKIVKGKYIPITNNKYRNELKTLCYSMLHQLPSSRPTLNQILKHKLLQNRIRDFYISCYKKFKKNIISNSTFNNLKNQLYQIGLTNILENIDDITKKQNLKKQQKRKLKKEQKSIEKEKKIQKDMEVALEKLKMERKWRAAKKKQRQKIINKYDRNNYNFGAKRDKMRSFAQQQTMADKRRQAAKQRKLQILRQQEQKRQELAAKHRNKQLRAAERKCMELNRKMPNYKSPPKLKSKLKYHKSPIQKNEEEQVEQLNIWENVHFKNIQSKKINIKQYKLNKEIPKESAHKSALLLLQQKIKYQKEYDALDMLKKRRELIQKRLNEISEKHKQRQIKKKSMYNNNNVIKKRDTKSEPAYISNHVESKSKSKSKSNVNIEKKATSLQSTPYRKPRPIAKIPFLSPEKAKSATGSPLKYGVMNIMSTESSKLSSMSVSPAPEMELDANNMNPRQQMEARKKAKADLRAKQIQEANVIQYKTNQLQAQENKYKNMDNNKNKLLRSASVEIFDEIINECDDMLSGCAISEPPINEFPHVIMTIEENNELNEIEEDIEEDIVEEEINELNETLVQHTKQIEEIKNEILQQRKTDLSDSDNDDDDSVDDVETLLNEQEQTMKTMRLNQENNNVQNENISVVEIPNNMNNDLYNDNKMDEDNEDDIIKEENELNDESDESSEEMPIGRLVDRIEFIKRKCVNAMGLDGFKIGYNFMKQLQFEENDDCMILIDNKIKQLCINSDISQSKVEKYRSLIDQLLFIEANCS